MQTPDGDIASLVRGGIRVIADYPSPGIQFQDITPLLADGAAFAQVISALAEPYRGRVDVVAGIEARGFILAAPVAVELGVGFVPLRKKGKLPHTTVAAAYDLEYGQAEIEMHIDGVGPGHQVLLMDDVLATGGTAAAACSLLEQLGSQVVAAAFLLEIGGLAGRDRLADRELEVLLST